MTPGRPPMVRAQRWPLPRPSSPVRKPRSAPPKRKSSMRRLPAHRLHVAGVLALLRADAPPKPGVARTPVPLAPAAIEAVSARWSRISTSPKSSTHSFLLTAFAVFAFGVPFRGSFVAFTAAALLYVVITTAMGLVISSFMTSQIAAIFATAAHHDFGHAMGIFLARSAGTMPQFGLLLMLGCRFRCCQVRQCQGRACPQIIQDIMLAAPNTHFVILA
jgi:hypothetical protein